MAVPAPVQHLQAQQIKEWSRDLLSRMAHRTIYMMLMIDVVQFSWSVVSAYCMRETGRAGYHLGHHPRSAGSDDVASVLKDKPSLAKKRPPIRTVRTASTACCHLTSWRRQLPIPTFAFGKTDGAMLTEEFVKLSGPWKSEAVFHVRDQVVCRMRCDG